MVTGSHDGDQLWEVWRGVLSTSRGDEERCSTLCQMSVRRERQWRELRRRWHCSPPHGKGETRQYSNVEILRILVQTSVDCLFTRNDFIWNIPRSLGTAFAKRGSLGNFATSVRWGTEVFPTATRALVIFQASLIWSAKVTAFVRSVNTSVLQYSIVHTYEARNILLIVI